MYWFSSLVSLNSSSIPVSFLWIPVPFLLIPEDSCGFRCHSCGFLRIPEDSWGFLQEWEEHCKVLNFILTLKIAGGQLMVAILMLGFMRSLFLTIEIGREVSHKMCLQLVISISSLFIFSVDGKAAQLILAFLSMPVERIWDFLQVAII